MGGEIYRIFAGVTHPISLGAIALAVVLAILKLRNKSISPLVWIVILLLVIGPIAISAYVELRKDPGASIYRVRVIVIDPQKLPVEDAKVWSSVGGEPKKVAGGWEFDIPKASKPIGGALTVYAAVPNSFVSGSQELRLGDDLNPSVTIQLQQQNSASVRGNVVDVHSRAIPGARVCVVGYENEAVITEASGNFVLPAHAGVDQQVQLHVEKTGYAAKQQLHPAGNFPATIVLERK